MVVGRIDTRVEIFCVTVWKSSSLFFCGRYYQSRFDACRSGRRNRLLKRILGKPSRGCMSAIRARHEVILLSVLILLNKSNSYSARRVLYGGIIQFYKLKTRCAIILTIIKRFRRDIRVVIIFYFIFSVCRATQTQRARARAWECAPHTVRVATTGSTLFCIFFFFVASLRRIANRHTLPDTRVSYWWRRRYIDSVFRRTHTGARAR